jgi:hypothetical protein
VFCITPANTYKVQEKKARHLEFSSRFLCVQSRDEKRGIIGTTRIRKLRGFVQRIKPSNESGNMFHPATHYMALEYLMVYTGVLSKGELNIVHLTLYCRRSPWSFSEYHEKSKLSKFGPHLPNSSFCGNRVINLTF